MHPYIPHLLADIHAAHRSQDNVAEETPQTLEEHMEEVEGWIAGETLQPEHTFGYYCELESAHFPPPEQLSDEDMIRVCNAFEKLLFSWHSSIDLPKKFPLPLRYTFTVGTLDEGFTVVKSGFLTFDYCSGYAPDCIFKEYCPCLEFWNNADG